MHQLVKRSMNATTSNLSPITKYRRHIEELQQKTRQSPQHQNQDKKYATQSMLNRIKKRTFSLSKLQSVQKSQIGQLISTQKKTQQQKQCFNDRLVFQKLNFNSDEGISQSPSAQRQRNLRNPFFSNENNAQQQLSLLKQILKKKQQDLILIKQKQSQIQKIENNEDLQSLTIQNSAVKRIKLLKKTKQYEFYDNLVHNLLNNINKDKPENDNHLKYDNQQNGVNQNKSFKSKSLSNIKRTIDKQKFRKTCTTNYTSTKLPSGSVNKNSISISLFNKKKDSMIFRLSDLTSDNVYEKKITTFIEFLYKVNFSNSIYVDLSLSSGSGQKGLQKKTFKVFIGRGNNSQLLKSVVKRRFWLQMTSNKSQANFIWTQDTQKQMHLKQLQQQKVETQQETKQDDGRPCFSLKHKFTSPLYCEQSNLKVLNSKDIDDANSAFSRSYLGLKSPYALTEISLITNHIPNNSIIGSKKILFKLMHWYYSQIQKIDPFLFLPHTYHIIPGDKENLGIKKFKQEQVEKKDRIWIVKPGQNTNRGNGISVASTGEIQRLMKYKKFHKNGQLKTFIVQKYLKPFLYNSRKFDIRHYMLITSVNGIMKGYWYNSGYIRTSSEKFDMDELDNDFIHLTNDAIQKNSEDYGKYEEGNKLSYSQFQRYLDNTVPHKKYDFQKQIISEMKKITTDVLRAGFMFLDPDRNQRLSKGRGCNFQLYGMDFMIDHKFKPYLIQINANPCLQISCPLLQRLIPIAIEHTFRLALDPVLPPNDHYTPSKRYQLSDRILDRLKFQLIFDQKHQGKQLRKKYKACQNKFELNGMALQPEQDLFEDDGQVISDDKLFQQGKQ